MGTLPNVTAAIYNYFQQLTFSMIQKSVVGYELKEVSTNVNFYGMWQPAGGRKLEMMPQGQRMWKTHTLYSDITLILKPDDVVTYLGNSYRVMSVADWKLYGFFMYDLQQDYSNPSAAPSGMVNEPQYLITENGEFILTEDGQKIIV
jgi:hypothetical protein